MKNQKGFTVVELVIAIGILLWLAAIGFALYAGCHFIAKFW